MGNGRGKRELGEEGDDTEGRKDGILGFRAPRRTSFPLSVPIMPSRR